MTSAQWELDEDSATWRDRMALRLLRGFVVVCFICAGLIWFTVDGSPQRWAMTALALAWGSLLFYPAISGRPAGVARRWLVIVPALVIAITSFALLGFLSGPGVLLAVTVLLSGLLLGRRAMIATTAVSAVLLACVIWAMVTGLLSAPDPRNVAMTHVTPWVRSVVVTFFGIALFGDLMLALVERMERSLQLARSAVRERAQTAAAALEAQQLETVGRLAAGVAHDFNNNLTAIMGSAELLRQEIPTTGRAGTLLDGILNASQRAAELTGQLLAYSRKGQMRQVPTDLHRVLLDAVSLLRTSFATNIAVVTQLAAPRTIAVADAALLQSAMLNLLVNAVDAMPDGGTLSVTTANFSGHSGDPAAGMVLTVQDTGKGIEPELLSKIFDPFFTTKPVGKGTGLGLAAVAGTIKAHRGKIEVESRVGVGTVFRISLPLLEGEVLLANASEGVGQQGEGEILLVEDDSMVSTAALSTLRSLGYRPTHVADGQRAIDVVQADPQRFRLVILDLRMPGMSGEQTFGALQAIAPQLPVLIWSGYGAEQDVAGMLSRGAAGFVQKPYRVADLDQAIREALAKGQQKPPS